MILFYFIYFFDFSFGNSGEDFGLWFFFDIINVLRYFYLRILCVGEFRIWFLVLLFLFWYFIDFKYWWDFYVFYCLFFFYIW